MHVQRMTSPYIIQYANTIQYNKPAIRSSTIQIKQWAKSITIIITCSNIATVILPDKNKFTSKYATK